MKKQELKILFKNMVCSWCGEDFDEKSFKILREENDFIVLQVSCSKCKKSFGIAFLGNVPSVKNDDNFQELPLIFEDTPKQITADEVIDAHNFLKNLDKDWQKHIPNDFISK